MSGVVIPAHWVCAVVICGRRADEPHVDGCHYAALDADRSTDPSAGSR